MSKKVIVTGGAGFIGHQVINELLNQTDWKIVTFDRLSYSGNLKRIDDILKNYDDTTKDRFEFIYHDLKAPINQDIFKQIKDTHLIVHIGASSHVTKSINNPLLFLQDNVLGTFNILEVARNLDNLELFHYFSTDEVFGPSSGKNKFSEWDRYNSKNPYSASKAAAEEYVISYENTYSIPSLITHCSNVYGERQHWEKFIPNTINKILNNEKITVHTDDQGVVGSRYYIHNEDVAKSVVYLINNFKKVDKEAQKVQEAKPTKVNITGNSLISNLEIVEMIGQYLNKEYEYILTSQDPTRPKHDFKYGLDNSLIKSLGAEFDRDFKTGLKKTVDWYTANPMWLG